MLTIQDIGIDLLDGQLFRNISVTIFPGSIVRIKGQNGSGKTTFLRILAGVYSNYYGHINLGSEIASLPVNYLAHNLGIKDDLTLIEQLEFWSKICGNPILISSAVKYCGFEDMLEDYCYRLSSGNRQKLAMSRLIMAYSNFWLLDEIDSGMDDNNLSLLRNLILAKSNSGGIIIFSSHRDFLTPSFILDMEDYSAKAS